jgi:Ca-activated chloride channel family protein
MQVNARLDLDVVALEQDDQVTVMLELIAPASSQTEARPPASVEVVLDRSGSMHGERLPAAKDALVRLIDRLAPSDRLGVVAFDDQVEVVLPAGPIEDRAAAKAAVRRIEPRGSTNLSSGLLRGLQEARRVSGGSGATVLLLSDGHANQGEVDPVRLAQVAASARGDGMTVSTIGIGLGYDELLMSELARGGSGNHTFTETGDAAAAAVAGEVEGLLSRTVQAVSLIIRPQAEVESVRLWNDLPGHPIEGGIMVDIGDLWADEHRTLLVSFHVPASGALGLAQVAELELRYVTVPDLVEQTITLPVHVNVVPGDQAAGRIADPVVRTELAYQQAQEAKRQAAEYLREGSVEAASLAYSTARAAIDASMAASPSAELAEEREILERLELRAAAGDLSWTAKTSRSEQARKSRRRGR